MIKRCGWTVLCLTTRPRPARYGWTCQELPPTGIAQRVIGVHKPPYHDKGTSSAAINLMAEHRISYRKRCSFKLDVIPTTFSASNVRRTPKTKSRQTTVISKTKRAASKAAVTLEKLVRDKTLCKDIRKLSTQYQTSSIAIEPSTASIALLSTLLQRCQWKGVEQVPQTHGLKLPYQCHFQE
ncbi:hypothetical protein LSAT2_030765 [Lamellibrachia satsuma]|nr:hypothetical protein LSAT2_030765 [Lamellibrachia satsuma]